MTDTMSAAPPFRLKIVPILVVAALGEGIPYLAAYSAYFSHLYLHTAAPDGPALDWLFVHHAFQLLYGLLFIIILKRFQPFDAGLRWPPGKTYIRAALLWGVVFGVLMTVVDYLPDLLARRPMDLGFPLAPHNIAGWSFFEGVYVGPTEEIPFRALLVGYLIAAMPGKLRLGRYEMSWAGVIVAVLFALAHAASFDTHAWQAALGQQVYAFALGILYAYWFEKSRSVVAPIIGHNAGDVIEYAICFAWIFMTR